jgi:hypothetical protein
MKLQLHKQLWKYKVGPTPTVDVDETTRTKKVDAVDETITTRATTAMGCPKAAWYRGGKVLHGKVVKW